MSILPKPTQRATGKARTQRPAARPALAMPAPAQPTRLNPIACDCCNRPASYFEVRFSECEFPFGSLKYAICDSCSMEHPDGVPKDLKLSMLAARAGRFGQQWQAAVRSMLEYYVGPQP